MEDIAEAAGTSKSVFYRYFDDKAGLQEAVADRVLTRVKREVVSAVGSEPHAVAGLREMVSAYLHLIERSRNVYEFVTQDDSSEELRGFFKTITELIESNVAAVLSGSAAGARREATLAYWPHAGVGLIRSVSEAWLYSPAEHRPPLEEIRDLITHWLAFGLAPQSTGSDEPPGAVVVPDAAPHSPTPPPTTHTESP
ncbi:hypothetical protein GCM10009595_06050 [Falsarthrobacter nasiphocae]